MTLHFLSSEEEKAIKANIPWEMVDRWIREAVRLANEIAGIATVQSCAGHISSKSDGFHVQSATIAFRASEERAQQILFDVAPKAGVWDVEIRYFSDGTFWISLHTDPSERPRLYELFETLGGKDES